MALLAREDQPVARERAISVLIVDDSAVARAAMSRIVGDAPGLFLAGVVHSAEQAMSWLSDRNVDVIVLDIEMPGRGGLAALPDLHAVGKGAQILIVSSSAREGAQATVRALALGAADTLEKPSSGQINQSFGAVLIDRVQRIGRARGLSGRHEQIALRPQRSARIDLLVIGASTGGLSALRELLGNLPTEFAAPILITQHLPAAFMPYFAAQVAVMAQRAAFVATQGRIVARGEIAVAPGDAHLVVQQARERVALGLSRDAAPTRCCPSVDPMFASAAALGVAAAGVVLSGMGRDGLLGATAMVEAGGTVIVQDSSSSAVWGMPGTVARAGLASYVGPPSGIAAYLERRGS